MQGEFFYERYPKAAWEHHFAWLMSAAMTSYLKPTCPVATPATFLHGSLPSMSTSERHLLRPDALLITGPDDDQYGHAETYPPALRNISIIEIKYCMDMDRSNQESKALSQHQKLIDALVTAGHMRCNIHVLPLLVGVSGTIYKDTHAQLMALGVTSHNAEHTLRKLHEYSIHKVDSIARTRWYLQHTAPARVGHVP